MACFSSAVDSDTAVSYKSDSTAPKVNVLIQAYDSAQSLAGDKVSPGTSVNLGGTEKQYAKFEITGEDANGIEGIRSGTPTSVGTGSKETVSKQSYTGTDSIVGSRSVLLKNKL